MKTSITLHEGDEQFDRYLRALRPGMSYGHAEAVKRLSPEELPDGRLRYTTLHPTLGRFHMRVTRPVAQGNSYGLFAEVAAEEALTYPWEVKRREDDWLISVSHRSALGYSGGSYVVEAIEIEVDELPDTPGACKACGDRTLKMRLPIEFTVDMIDERSAHWNGEATVGNYLITASCAGCGVRRDDLVSIGALRDFSINGVSFDGDKQGIIGSRPDQPPLSDLQRGSGK